MGALLSFTRQLQTNSPNSATIGRLTIVPSVYYYGNPKQRTGIWVPGSRRGSQAGSLPKLTQASGSIRIASAASACPQPYVSHKEMLERFPDVCGDHLQSPFLT